jgi:hypothetical protein
MKSQSLSTRAFPRARLPNSQTCSGVKHLDDARDHLRRNARRPIDAGSGLGHISRIPDPLARDRSRATTPDALPEVARSICNSGNLREATVAQKVEDGRDQPG